MAKLLDPICGWCADGLCDGSGDDCTFGRAPIPCACNCQKGDSGMNDDIETAVNEAVTQVNEGEQPAERIKAFIYPFEGDSYTIRSDAMEDLEILEWIEDEHLIKALRRILGPDQWEKFKDSQREPQSGRVKVDKLEDFLNGLFSRLGAGKA